MGFNSAFKELMQHEYIRAQHREPSVRLLQGVRSKYIDMCKPIQEERKLRVFENRVLRRIFEPRRDEVAGE